MRDKVTRQCPQKHTTFWKRKEIRNGIEPRFFRLPAYRLTARPNRLSTLCCFDSLINPENLSREDTDSVGGKPRGDRDHRVALQWRDQFWQSLQEGAGKPGCLECDIHHPTTASAVPDACLTPGTKSCPVSDSAEQSNALPRSRVVASLEISNQ